MTLVPILSTSVIAGLAGLDGKSSGKLSARALGFYLVATVVATVTGITFAMIIKPGQNSAAEESFTSGNSSVAADSILDLFRFVLACLFLTPERHILLKRQLKEYDFLPSILHRNLWPANLIEACINHVGISNFFCAAFVCG